MSVRNARPAKGRTAIRAQVLDRVFLGGCIATYLVLMIAVVAALQAYGS